MQAIPRAGRKGISPVLATVILIAITLVAAAAVSGFLFGLLGTYSNSALVSASASPVCSGTPESCTLTLVNSGNLNTVLAGTCTLNFGGSSYLGTATLTSGSLGGGQTAHVTCTSTIAGSHAAAGSQLTGSVLIANGANVLFATASS